MAAVAIAPKEASERAVRAALASLAMAAPGRFDPVVVVVTGRDSPVATAAREAGAIAVPAPRAGYGRSCLAGITRLASLPPPDAPDVVVFFDADGGGDPAEIERVLAPVLAGEADLSVGSRARRGPTAPDSPVRNGALPAGGPGWGRRIAAALIRLRTGYRFTDLGPLRAIRWETLRALGTRDPDYGWLAEMQVRAALAAIPVAEVPVTPGAPASARRGAVERLVAAAKILMTVLLPLHPEPLAPGRNWETPS